MNTIMDSAISAINAFCIDQFDNKHLHGKINLPFNIHVKFPL